MPLDLAPFSVLKESPVCGNQISSCSSSMCFCCCLLRIHVCGHVENVTHITPYTIGQCVGSQRQRRSHTHCTHTHTNTPPHTHTHTHTHPQHHTHTHTHTHTHSHGRRLCLSSHSHFHTLSDT